MVLREDRGVAKPIHVQEVDLKQLLEAQSKSSLVALMVALASESEAMKRRMMLQFSDAGNQDVIEESRRTIRSQINVYTDRHGFLSLNNVYDALRGAYAVFDRAESALNDEEWTLWARLHFCLIEEMIRLLDAADDSGGTIGSLITDSLSRLLELAEDREGIPTEDQEALFHLMLKESRKSYYDDWSEWRLEVLKAAYVLADTEVLLSEWERVAGELIASEPCNAWGDHFFQEEIMKLRYNRLACSNQVEQANEMLRNNLHITEFREFAIQNAIAAGNYEDAVQLAEEGEMLARQKGFAGLVKKWKLLRYDAYTQAGSLEAIRRLGIELVLDGEFQFYKQVKETYTAEHWKAVYTDILTKLGNDYASNRVYTSILVEEKELALLLEYVSKQPSRIEEYAGMLLPVYPREVKGLYSRHIEAAAKQATNRSGYANVCGIIRRLRRLGCSDEARNMAVQLLQQYARKPAFCDELEKLGYV